MAKKEAKELIDMIKDRKALLAGVMSKYMTPDEMINIMTLAFGRQPELKECTPYSVLASVMTAGQLGLKPSSPHGHCYIIPFRNKKTGKTEATFIVGYKGLIELALRSGKVASIESHVVHKNDEFNVTLGTEPNIDHRPNILNPGEMIAVYAVATPKDFGAKQFEIMTKAEVDKIRNSSKAKNSGPWVDWYEPMAVKSVIKKLCKYLSLSPEMAIAVEVDNRAESSEVRSIGDVIDVKGVAEVLEVEDDKTPDIQEPKRKSEMRKDEEKGAKDQPLERKTTPDIEPPTNLFEAGCHNAKEVLGKDRFYQIIKGFKQNSKNIVHEDDIKGQALKDIVLQKLSMEIDKAAEKEEK